MKDNDTREGDNKDQVTVTGWRRGKTLGIQKHWTWPKKENTNILAKTYKSINNQNLHRPDCLCLVKQTNKKLDFCRRME